MKRADVLVKAAECVLNDRNNTYGGPEQAFAKIAKFWSAYLDTEISATDVSAMMALLKLARISNNPTHVDSWVDLAGYAACGGEIANDGTE